MPTESARRFVIMYRGREGSSPLISTIAKHPAIHVPLFETLDFYTARNWARADTIAATLDEVLHGRAVQRNGAAVAAAAPDRAEAASAIGFKWRFWGEATGVTPVLLRHRVTLFHLFRRNLLELTASLYFSNTVVPAVERDHGLDLAGGGHMQFKLAKLDPATRTALLGRLADVRFTIPPEDAETIAKRIFNDKRTKLDTYGEPLRAGGGDVFSILYEDYCNDRHGLVRAMEATIGMDASLQTDFGTNYTKVTGNDFMAQIENIDDLRSSPRLQQITRSYERLIFERHTYLRPQP